MKIQQSLKYWMFHIYATLLSAKELITETKHIQPEKIKCYCIYIYI